MAILDHFGDIWVIDLFHYLEFIFQRIDIFLRHFSFRKNFNCEVFVCFSVLSLTYDGERAFADGFLDLVEIFDVPVGVLVLITLH